MSTLSNLAPVPSTPDRPANLAALLQADAFTSTDLADISDAGCIFAAAIADISRHHIGDLGIWDCHRAALDELARLHAALDQMSEAIEETRTGLSTIERRARRAATLGGAA